MFKERLVFLRKKRNLTQNELAERMNISRGQIANYELGRGQPDLDMLVNLADFFSELHIATDFGRKIDILKNDLNNSKYLTLEQIPLSEDELDMLSETLDFSIRLVKRIRKVKNNS